MAGKHSNEKKKKSKLDQETRVYDPEDTRRAAAQSVRNSRNARGVTNSEDPQFKKSRKQPKKKKRGLRTFGKVVLILAIILGILVGVIFWYINDKLNKVQRIELNDEELGISDNIGLEDYRNIAILGIDARADTYGTGNRSDNIMIASMNNKTKETKLISVYRDTYVDIEGHGLDKITHAYSYGSAQLALNTLNKNLDLNIKEFVTVNFDAVQNIVNNVGGIDMTIDADEIKHISGISSTGTHHLNGEQALEYARIRKEAGGDYKRTERMRDVLQAVLSKVKTMGIGEINTLLDKTLPQVYTNITTGDILSMVPSLASIKVTESAGWPYDTKGITLDRWYGVPITLESNVTRLHQEIFDQTNYTPSQTVKDISDRIVQRTGYTK